MTKAPFRLLRAVTEATDREDKLAFGAAVTTEMVWDEVIIPVLGTAVAAYAA